MHRPTIGVLAIVLLATAAALFPMRDDDNTAEGMFSACLRVGILLSALWLAHPQLNRVPWWLLSIIGLIVLGVLAVRGHPRTTLVLILVVAIVLRVRNFMARSGHPREKPRR